MKKQSDGKEVKHSKRQLRCELVDSEILQAGKQLADRMAELLILEVMKSQSAAEFAGKIKAKELVIADLIQKIQSRYERRDVSCAEMLDTPEPGKKTINRTDTGETIAIEDMSASEMQRELEVA